MKEKEAEAKTATATANETPSEYVVMVISPINGATLRELLDAVQGLDVLGIRDETTALVTAPGEVVARVALEHPELLIEANIRYRKPRDE